MDLNEDLLAIQEGTASFEYSVKLTTNSKADVVLQFLGHADFYGTAGLALSASQTSSFDHLPEPPPAPLKNRALYQS